MDTKELIKLYLESKQMSWAPSTQRSEALRLGAYADVIDGNARRLWKATTALKPYSRVTLWTRVTSFYQWCIDRGLVKSGNSYRLFREEHERLFKNAYERKTPEISFEEAQARIETIEDEVVRSKALQLLTGGLRWSESNTIRDSHVTGKGGRRRRVYCAQDSGPSNQTAARYHTVLRALRELGLRPHDLRKLFATRLARQEGIQEADLMEVMGWKTIQTATSYLAPMRQDMLADAIRKMVKKK